MPRPSLSASPARQRSFGIIQTLEKQIQESILQAGDCLPSEKTIGAQFGVSRTVVRDALQALKSRGVLESRRGSGTYVAKLGHTSVRDSLSWYAALQKDGPRFLEMMDLRILVETHCARLLAASKLPLHEVKKHLMTMERSNLKLKQFADADIAFHLAIVKASGHSLFYEVAYAVLPALGKNFARHTLIDPKVAQEVLADHQHIFSALEKGQPIQAESRLRAHLLRSRDNLKLILSKGSPLDGALLG